jgi:hypothetical protein
MTLIKNETGEATFKTMMDIFNSHVSHEVSHEVILSERGHERWNKVRMLYIIICYQ